MTCVGTETGVLKPPTNELSLGIRLHFDDLSCYSLISLIFSISESWFSLVSIMNILYFSNELKYILTYYLLVD